VSATGSVRPGLHNALRLLHHHGWVKQREVVIGLAALAAGAGAAWLAVDRSFHSSQTADAPLALIVGWSFVVSGLIAWRQRPENRLGPAMTLTGFAWFASFLADWDSSVPFTIGTAIAGYWHIGLAYVFLTFPSGRFRSVWDRGLVWGAVVLHVGLQLPALLLSDSQELLCKGCPANAFEIHRSDAVARAITDAQRGIGVVLVVFALVLVAWRWHRATQPQRQQMAPVLWTGGAALLALALTTVNESVGHPLGEVPRWLGYCALASIPVAVLVVLAQRHLARTAVAGLVVELGGRREDVDLRDALARALGDPRLELAYWFPTGARYVDAEGRPVALPAPDDDRAATVIERDGQPVAALIHDSALRDERELVDSVCAAASLTIENERLQAELRARLVELQDSRGRLVEATETERRRIERDLHDGTQQRLVSIAMSLGLAESKLPTDPATAAPLVHEAREALAVALQELRELSQGIHPSILTERGLPAALDELCRRAALPATLDVSLDGRLPAQVETAAYFVVSEALTNAVKHSHATALRISAAREGRTLIAEVVDDGIGGAAAGGGSGLRGLADRVEALGGRLTVSSPPGRGTTIHAEIPCA
jgi:signal transduction histidine kinase